MKKRIISLLSATAIVFGSVASANYGWATEAVNFCVNRGILSGTGNGDLALGDGLTREQMAKMLCDSFGIAQDTTSVTIFGDISADRWSYGYVNAISSKLFGGEKRTTLKPEEYVSREEFCATMVLAYGMTGGWQRNPNLIDYNYTDSSSVTQKYRKLLTVAIERGLMSGADGKLRPNANLTRAEACSLLHRAISLKNGSLKVDPKELGVIQSRTSMFGESAVTIEQAKMWAARRGATESFIAAAEIYWKYGGLTGIRPEILYAQSAKETGFGKYTGAVRPEQNNFAGIKKYGASGDATEDHESFETQDDGVRAHFNHMSAYVGLAPIGETHGRYKSVKSLSWAGSVKYLEDLGGKWCPDLYYGFSILHDYIEPMMKGN